MNFPDAIRSAFLKKYGTFSGRASRSEFWYVLLFLLLILLVIFGVASAISMLPNRGDDWALLFFFLSCVVALLGVTIPVLALIVRRFHDIGLSGWWYLASIFLSNVAFVIIGSGSLEVSIELAELSSSLMSLAVFAVTVWPSTTGVNKYGENPHAQSDVTTFE